VWLVLGAACLSPVLRQGDLLAWLVGASVIAVLGFVDDLRPLPAATRFLAQIAVAALVLVFALGDGEVAIAADLTVRAPRALMLALGVLFVVGTTNIYNFMDGMDGLAATQATSAGLALGVASAAAGHVDIALVAFVVAAASAGFFVHNAPPAALFLGDAGSTFIGFTFAVLALVAATRPSPLPVGVVPVALAPFLLDGTFTILRRLSKGERIWTAHRSHLYQRAVATGRTHRDVLVVYAAWSAAAAAGALLARGDAQTALAMAVAMGIALAPVWRWVVRLESQ
jgi:Fuc2NAc and GlcNAc transferase